MKNDELADLIASYKPSEQAHQILEETKVVLIVGISGAGKGTVLDALVSTGKYRDVITHTTREVRYNNGRLEQDGVDYHFITHETAQKMLKDKAFIEADFHMGNIYGSSIAELERARDEGKTAVADIDVNGVDNYMRLSGKVLPIFLVPPSYAVWIERLKSRFTDGWYKHADDIRDRTARASYEIQRVLERGYYHLVINDKLDDTVAAVQAIVAGYHQTPEEIEKARAIMLEIKRESESGTLDD